MVSPALEGIETPQLRYLLPELFDENRDMLPLRSRVLLEHFVPVDQEYPEKVEEEEREPPS